MRVWLHFIKFVFDVNTGKRHATHARTEHTFCICDAISILYRLVALLQHALQRHVNIASITHICGKF